jgi:hypothetical protein
MIEFRLAGGSTFYKMVEATPLFLKVKFRRVPPSGQQTRRDEVAAGFRPGARYEERSLQYCWRTKVSKHINTKSGTSVSLRVVFLIGFANGKVTEKKLYLRLDCENGNRRY